MLVNIYRIAIFVFLLLSIQYQAICQNFSDYGFRASLPCDLKKEKTLNENQIRSMGVGDGIISWTSFRCVVNSSRDEDAVYRVVAMQNRSNIDDHKAWVKTALRNYKRNGYKVERLKYRGEVACGYEILQRVDGREFKSKAIDIPRGDWTYTLQVLASPKTARRKVQVLKEGFRLE